MPALKQITCSIELGNTGIKLKEYQHRVTDGGVEAYVAVVPDADIPFHIHVTSSGYIAPGLAIYVFIDGQYQCNRNQHYLKVPTPGMDSAEYEVDICLSQKEDIDAQGHNFVGREWTFKELTKADPNNLQDVKSNLVHNVGTIEVVILRCKDSEMLDMLTTYPPPGSAIAPVPRVRELKGWSKSQSGTSTKAFSRNESSTIDGMLVGISRLFDGANDDPEPFHWTPSNYAISMPTQGNRSYQKDHQKAHAHDLHHRLSARSYNARGRDLHRRFDSQPIGDNFKQSIWHASELQQPVPQPTPQPTPQRSYRQPKNEATYQQHRSASVEPVLNASEFTRDICDKIDANFRLLSTERMQLLKFQQDAETYRNDPGLHFAALKALRVKERYIQNLAQEVEALFQAILTRMKRMDHAEWQFAKNYILLDKRLLPWNHPELQQWQDPKLLHIAEPSQNAQSVASKSGRDDGRQQANQGKTGIFQADAQNQKTGSGQPVLSKQNIKLTTNNYAGGQGGGSTRSANQNAGWATNQVQNDTWGNEAHDWQSRTHQSKVEKWNDGAKVALNADWANRSINTTRKKSQAGSGASHAKPSNSINTATSAVPQPIIKPYWADWQKPNVSPRKQRKEPRDPHLYPALTAPVAAPGAPSSADFGVQVGRGGEYTKDKYKPHTVDSMEKPYAIFTFKYRSAATLEKALGCPIDTSQTQKAIHEWQKAKIMQRSRTDVASEMLKLQNAHQKKKSAPKGATHHGHDKPPEKKQKDEKSPNTLGWASKANTMTEVKPNDSASQWGMGGGWPWGKAQSEHKSQSGSGTVEHFAGDKNLKTIRW